MPRKHTRLFIIILVVGAALMLYQGKQGAMSPVESLSSGVALINETATGALNYAGSVLRRIFRRESELEIAKAEADRLRVELMRSKELQAENIRLSELLNLKDNTPSYVASGRVIARGTDRWANTFMIDKGAEQGVQKNMAVITPLGLLGKVQSSNQNSAVILLVDDPRFSASVRLATTRTEAVLSGAGRGRCVLKYADIDTAVSNGEVVLTSGLDALFPFGIPVGEVTGVASSGQDEFFQHIELRPFVNPSAVEEVIVVRR